MSMLVLIRHGETEMAGKFCGHSELVLNGKWQWRSVGAQRC
jgi:broad specificity phosphatase PhoE